MTKQIKILKIENRITLLNNRPKDNGKIVQKLKRQYKALKGTEYVADSEE